MQATAIDTAGQRMMEVPAGMAASYYEPIVRSILEVFETMVMVTVTPGKPLERQITCFENSVSGMIGLSGDYRGMLAIHCPERTAREVTGALLGDLPEDIDDDVKDTVGELVNMAAGGIKSHFQGEGELLELSVLSICSGRNYTINLLSRAEWLIIPFAMNDETFLVEFKLARPN